MNRSLGVALAVFTLALPAVAAAQPHVFKTERVKKGPRVVLAPRPGTGTAVLAVVFPVGAVDDAGKPGFTRLVQRALLDANERLPEAELQQALYSADASLDMVTELRRSYFLLSAPSAEFDKLSARLLGGLLDPELDGALLSRARDRALHADARRGGSQLERLLAPSLVDDWRYQNDPLGDRSSLDSISNEDLQKHLEKYFDASNATLVFSGDFEPKKVKKAVRRFKGGGRPSPSLPAPNLLAPLEVNVTSRLEIRLLGYVASVQSAKDQAALNLLAAIAQDRMGHALRAEGLGYAFSVIPARFGWVDTLAFFLPSEGKVPKDVGPLLKAQGSGLKSPELIKESFERNRAFLVKEADARDLSPEPLARAIIEGGTAWTPADVRTALLEMKAEDVIAYAERSLVDSQSYYVIFSPSH